jgi:C1A family cysteine protease
MIIKYVLPVFVLFLSGCFDGGDESSANVTETQKMAEKIQESLSDDFIAWQQNGGDSGELIPSPIAVEVSDTATQARTSHSLATRAIPTSFSLKSFMSPVKNQGSCGISWAFATFGAIEGSYAQGSVLDLSEDHLKHLNGYDTIQNYGACSGGNIWKSLGYLSNYKGAVDEINDIYAVSSQSDYCLTCKASHYIDNAVFIPARSSISDNDVIKSTLYEQKKPLYATMQIAFGDSYDEATHSFYQSQINAKANHSVVIVGWDDGYEAQGEKGAFIVKNSWGSGVGDAGYYYVPYADQSIGFESLVYFEDVEDTLYPFDTLYSYDELGATAAMRIDSSTVEMSNVYKAQNVETLVGASFFVLDSGSDVEVEVHQVISQDPLVTQKIGPTRYSESDKLRGFYTVAFALDVEVQKDDLFAIVVRLSHTNTTMSLPVEAQLDYYASAVSASSMQSYYRLNDDWQDLTAVRSDLNFPIKVMSQIKDTAEDVKVSITTAKTKIEENELLSFELVFDPEGLEILSYAWNFDDATTSTLASPTHSFVASDEYNVSVQLLDTNGIYHHASTIIKVVGQGVSTLEDVNISIYENIQANTLIGKIPFNYSGSVAVTLSGSGSENFRVDTLGNIYSVYDNVFDYEGIKSYSLIATPLNGPGIDTSVSVIVSVLNVEEFEPTLADFSTTIAENSPTNTQVGYIPIISPGDSPISAITLSGAGSENFNVSSAGIITVASGAVLDYETLSNHQFVLEAVATNASNDSNVVNVLIALSNVAETVPVLSAFSTTIEENLAPGTVISSPIVLSTGDTPISQIVLSGDSASDFSINTEGVISVASGASIDFEVAPFSYTLEAVATNLKGDSIASNVSITISNVAEVAPTIHAVSERILENSALGLVIEPSIIDDGGDSAILSVLLTGDGASDFSLDLDGKLSVANGATIDYEQKTFYELSATLSNEKGASNTVDINITVQDGTPMITYETLAKETTASDSLGSDIALDETKMLIGAKNQDAGGSAYLYLFQANESYLQADVSFVPSDANMSHKFASAVSMSGNLMLIGDPENESNGSRAGAAYLFSYDSAAVQVSEIARIVSDDISADDLFGSSVLIIGDVIIVGAPNENSEGKVYLFKYNSVSQEVTQIAKFTASDIASGDGFGYDLAYDNNFILVGSENAEAAYLFSYANETVSETKILNFSGSVGFGTSVAIYSNKMIIGSQGSNKAYYFETNSNVSQEIINNNVKTNFGINVEINKDHITIGATESIFVYDTSSKILRYTLAIPDEKDDGNTIGEIFKLNGEHLAIGMPQSDLIPDNSGYVYVFDLEPSARPYLLNYKDKITTQNTNAVLAKYVVDSPNSTPITFSFSGSDKDFFSISNNELRIEAVSASVPQDANGDNIYEVTIILTDSIGATFSYPLSVTVEGS